VVGEQTMPTKKSEKIKKLNFVVDPYQGFTTFAANISLPGYTAFKMIRKETKATVWFRKVENS